MFDKPSSITRGAHATRLGYGLDRARFERADTSAGGTTTTLYVGDTEIVTAPDGAWRIRRHIAGLAIETTAFDAEDRQLSQEAAYVLRDHLGSVHLLTGQTGAVLQEMSFDAWGERRSPSTWGRLTGAGRTGFDSSRTTRGFTGHEMLDAVGIIHMNGRIHDPRLGMFLQVDSMVQDTGSPSGLNPYAYALGNPLNAVDADGEYATLLVGMIAALSGASAPSLALYVGSTAFLEALARGADFADALQGGVISGLSVYAAASIAAPAVPDARSLAKYGLAHGAVGGMTSVLRGGRFGHGFLTSALPATFGSSLGERLGGAVGSARAGRVIASAVLGGTASQLTGGKFVNGAATGAFVAAIGEVSRRLRPYGSGPTRLGPDRFTQDEKDRILGEIGEAVSDVPEEGFQSEADAALFLREAVQGIAEHYNIEIGFFMGDRFSDFAISEPHTTFHSWTVASIHDYPGAVVFHTHQTSSTFSGDPGDMGFALAARQNLYLSNTVGLFRLDGYGIYKLNKAMGYIPTNWRDLYVEEIHPNQNP